MVAAVAAALGAGASAAAGGPEFARRYQRFAVAADHPLASEAGAEILRAGGNAVDAAVATSFALSVVRPFSCGIGGGGFMVIAGADAPPTAICYREMAPAAIGPETYERIDDRDASVRGGLACGVPGTVAGLLHALEKYGSMDRARVLAPAIRLAREGFAADAAYAGAARGVIAKFDAQPEWKKRFAFTWERFLGAGKVSEGDIIKLPEQAAVLEAIAAHGREGFYAGEVGEAVVQAVRAAGGEITIEDLAAFKVVELTPLRTEFDGRVYLTMPPPSSGGLAMAQVFGLLERTKVREQVTRNNAAAYTQLVAEAFKHAFADRATWLGDPAFVDVPVARLLSGPYLDGLAKRIEIGRTHGPEWYGSRPEGEAGAPGLPDDGGTSHLCVVDADGLAVACTETINLHLGSLVSSDRLGFCLNNEMDDFTTRGGEANAFGLKQSDRNRPAAGKRPLSSMSPTIVLDADGRVRAVAGGSGGPRIITATTQVLLNALVRGDDAARAVERGRIHHQWSPNVLEVEPGFAERHQGMGVDIWMRKVHHQVATAKPAETACVQLIVREKDGWHAASDPRKGGRPAGE